MSASSMFSGCLMGPDHVVKPQQPPEMDLHSLVWEEMPAGYSPLGSVIHFLCKMEELYHVAL